MLGFCGCYWFDVVSLIYLGLDSVGCGIGYLIFYSLRLCFDCCVFVISYFGVFENIVVNVYCDDLWL